MRLACLSKMRVIIGSWFFFGRPAVAVIISLRQALATLLIAFSVSVCISITKKRGTARRRIQQLRHNREGSFFASQGFAELNNPTNHIRQAQKKSDAADNQINEIALVAVYVNACNKY